MDFAKSMRFLTSRPDLMVAAVLLLAIAMMILPLPPTVIDVFITFNLASAIILTMTVIYIRQPTEFSALPVVIVISTIFRLAVEITATRKILADGDAGELVRAFGEFVMGGNIVVGLIVFLIITVVQLLVISKGAERVAEVAARFTLDGIPGRQMAIDADLRSGEITQPQARERRDKLEEESQLFGAMDGAMKFVKGDTIAGIVILIVNIVGGISIGTLQRGMPIGEAASTYVLLSVGEALISQIPSLLTAIAAATVVTRVKGSKDRDLGEDIFGQLAGDGRALQVTGITLVAMCLVPGFPTIVLLTLGAMFGGAGFMLAREAKTALALAAEEQNTDLAAPAPDQGGQQGAAPGEQPAGQAAPEPEPDATPSAMVPDTRLTLSLSPALAGAFDIMMLQAAISDTRRRVSADLGITCPETGIMTDWGRPAFDLVITDEGVPIADHDIRPNDCLIIDDPAAAELLGLRTRVASDPDGRAQHFVHQADAQQLRDSGCTVYTPIETICAAVERIYRMRASSFVGIQEVRAIFQSLESVHGELVQEVWRTVPVARLAEVFRRLLDDNVSLRHRRLLLEGLAEVGERLSAPALVAEAVRRPLRHQICFRYVNRERALPVFIMEPPTEQMLRSYLVANGDDAVLVLPDGIREALLNRARAIRDKASEMSVIVCAQDIRRHVAASLRKGHVHLPVLGYEDLSEEFRVTPVGSVRLNEEQDGMAGLEAA
jgi:type III secretion protein V